METMEMTPPKVGPFFDLCAASLWRRMAIEPQIGPMLARAADLVGTQRNLKDLRKSHLLAMVQKMRAQGMAPGTINRYLAAVSKCLKQAKDMEYIHEVPAVPLQREPQGRTRWLTEEEERALADWLRANDAVDVAAFLEVAVDTGLRRGELVGGHNRGVVSGGWLQLDRTKNGECASVPLTVRARLHLEAFGGFRDLTVHRLRHQFERAREALGLHDVVIHSTRHTTATRLRQRGADLPLVARYMRHRTMKTTMRYAHVGNQDMERAAALL